MIEQTKQNAPEVASISITAVSVQPLRPRRGNRKRGLLRFLVLGAIAMGIPTAAITFFGSVRAMALYLNGHRVIANRQHINLGTRRSGEVCDRSVTVRNFRDVPICVTGVSLSCTCISVSPLPLDIQPGASASFDVRIRVISGNHQFDQTLTFLTNDQTDRGLAVRIRGTLTDTVPNHDRGSG